MAKKYVSNSKESVRMFKSDFLEPLSKVHFSIPIFIYVPVVVYFSVQALIKYNVTFIRFLLFFALGIMIWTLVEYLLHRFVFHFEPSGSFGKRLHFIFHGVHHDYPNDEKRLVMPPSVSVPLACLFYFLYSLLLEKAELYPFFSGFMLGYLIYDIGHYAIHHFNFKNKWFKMVKKHHMIHHYDDPERGFGVSSALWDHIFKSGFKKK
ncbi:sterol desaturase family protein [Chryseobacterium lathyri]|uniref:Sterol desaturase/sphingolipid hydroxylase (Fatty acid hydroxylase superfamily) n=1 Tax=Chryseobacterium lathyri TaxID=395933 RepID=A0ABT9SQY6_9FLAO|nr:sterol desaturase family protein [Chryseobacterium lathyri]MDP9961846.1 sterol desaturase/sphingolipid hydroxylase (fatty acid hydroxylase superfamily) [Chryseobacterium lathyri]MDQ0064217.1 sterol desaturase/sphingolipid hydroxylase (fatty acid hydroxylase superfamily) [Chryseobacterium lathyri]